MKPASDFFLIVKGASRICAETLADFSTVTAAFWELLINHHTLVKAQDLVVWISIWATVGRIWKPSNYIASCVWLFSLWYEHQNYSKLIKVDYKCTVRAKDFETSEKLCTTCISPICTLSMFPTDSWQGSQLFYCRNKTYFTSNWAAPSPPFWSMIHMPSPICMYLMSD